MGALLLMVVAGVWLYWRDRRPTSLENGIEEFHKELQALAPDASPPVRPRPPGQQPTDASAPATPPPRRDRTDGG